MTDWMIYGPTGYTGQLVAQEAVARGHRPLLVGRSREKLAMLADSLGLDYAVADINDREALVQAIRRVKLVYHAAGPFIYTAPQMIAACLEAGAHYLDITGELSVYQHTFAQHDAALARGVVLVSGVGFDVVPSDCLARYVAEKLPDATEIITVIAALGSSGGGVGVSAGTAKTELEMIEQSGFVERRLGQLVEIGPGSGARHFPMVSGDALAMPVPWGDLETVYRATGIPNITAYITLPPLLIRALPLLHTPLFGALRIPAVKTFATQMVERFISGPSEAMRENGRTQIYAETRNATGSIQQAWLETLEAYQFTAVAGVRAVEHVLAMSPKGALAPSQALGADFVMEIPGTQRWDERPVR
jgi:short subunit dehydrogenase-like uncharacterized protein